ncbi:PA14 domain-containing protein [Parvularcula lutaonensis]|uniref:PA14 domain-containing protein n=1 Tax=Parvularcula lutaonensis TaxID=491923 RepID=A0ABV7MAD5_9PROT|nr:hypothetical protein [Parvularcula lutaonensis]GGY44832.1 hypothetical protein GCM10007148_12210 [Parvularcula lutaonensis]
MNKSIAALPFVFASLANAASAAPILLDVKGQVWDSDRSLSSVDDALRLINTRASDAQFDVSAIDYPRGLDQQKQRSGVLLSDFLDDDAASLTGKDFSVETSAFLFTGMINLSAGENLFTVASDDGFELTIDDVLVSQHRGRRGFRSTSKTADLGGGLKAFTLVFFENRGRTGVEFLVNREVATAMAQTPAPGGLALMGAGMAFLAARRIRKGRAA